MSPNSQNASPPKLFNRNRIANRLARAWSGSPDFVYQLTLDDLQERLQIIKRKFERAAILGPEGRGFPSIMHSAEGKIDLQIFSTLVKTTNIPHLDPDNLKLPHEDYDLIVSILDLQIVNDVPGYLSQLRRFLRPDGLLLVATLGGGTFSELRTTWLKADAQHLGGAYARVAPFMDVKDAGALLQRTGYALPVTDVETHRVRYADSLAFFAEIRALGASNPLLETAPTLTTKNILGAAINAYPLDSDGRISATLEIIWMSGWAPHENQQKPLKPGSAEISLGKFLKDKS